MGRRLLLFFLSILFSFATRAQKIVPSGPTSFCAGGSVTLTVQGAEDAAKFQWKKDNVDISGETKGSYVAKDAAEYSVLISNRDGGKADTTLKIKVIVNTPPSPDFTFNDNACSGASVSFTPNVSNGKKPYSYKWEFGDGQTSTDANPTHKFDAFGCGEKKFNVSLTVTDDNGCTNKKTKPITIKERPEIKIKDLKNPYPPLSFNNCNNNPSPLNPNYTLEIGLDNPSSCITSYSVDWGDNSPVQNDVSFPLQHTYKQLGAFNLKVTGKGANGCSNTITQVVANQTNPGAGLKLPKSTNQLCVPATIPITIIDWQEDSPGTTYLLTFGDGEQVTLTYPLNSLGENHVIDHTYFKSNCPNPNFRVDLVVSNGCASTPLGGGNISVGIKPQANFTAPLIGCVGTSICFVNNTVQAYNSDCSKTVSYKWDFGDPTSSNNSSESSDPCHTFSKPGKYTVKLTVENGCGKDVFTKEICIEEKPKALFDIDANSGCANLLVKATNTTSEANACTPTTYKWIVNYSSTNCGTTGQWEFMNGTTETSKNPQFKFINPGTYSIILSATNGCGTNTSTAQQVVIKQPPQVTMGQIADFCGPNTIYPTINVTNCGSNALTYKWTIEGGTPTQSGSKDPGAITFSTPGLKKITVEVTNECGTTTVKKEFTIYPVPTVSVPENLKVCNNDKVNLSGFTASPPSSISWESDIDIGFGKAGSGSIASFTAVNTTNNALTATITVSAKTTTGGCIKSETFKITVNPTPGMPSGAPNISYCQNAIATPLIANASAGNSLLWYTTATGGVGNPMAPTPSTAIVGTKHYYVSQKNEVTGCESGRLDMAVTVNPIPSIDKAIPTNPSKCKGTDGKIELTGLTPNTDYLVSYNNGNDVQIRSDSRGYITLNNLSAGAYDIKVKLNGCPSNVISISLADPSAPSSPTVGSNSPVCEGSPINLTAKSTTPGTLTYNWQGPNNFKSDLQNPTIQASSLSSAGVYQVTVSQAGCTSAAGSVTVEINPTPEVTISANTPICSDNDLQLKSNTAFSNPFTYSWTGPNGFTSTDKDPKIANAQTKNSGTYKLIITAVAGNCKSPIASIDVVVNPTPTISNLSKSNPKDCASSTGSISFSVSEASKNFIVHYSQGGVPKQTTLSSNAAGTITIQNLPSGTYDGIYIVSDKNCSSNILGPISLTDPNPPAAPTAGSNSAICSGNELKLTASSIPNASYSWTGPNGFTAATQNPTIPDVSMSAAGTYLVTATVNSCTSAAGSVEVVVNQTPTISISSNSPLCSGKDLQLQSKTNFTGNLTYAWTGPNSFSSTEENPVIANAQTKNSGSYTLIVTATTGSCPSQPAKLVAEINLTPEIDNLKKTDPVNCKSATGTISFSVQSANTNFTVHYKENGADKTITILSDANKIITIKDLPSGTYDGIYIVSDKNCSSNILGPISLTDPNPPAAPTITGTAKICSGTTIELNATTVSNGVAKYSWSGPNGFVSNLQNITIQNASTNLTGVFNVTVSINECVSPAGSFDVIVDSTPTAPKISSNSPLCSGAELTLDFDTDFPGALTYKWNGPDNFKSVIKNPTIPSVEVKNSGLYHLTISSSENCTAKSQENVIIYQTPTITGEAVNPQNCGKPDGAIIIHGLLKNTTYSVSYTKDQEAVTTQNLDSDGNGDIIIKNLRQGDYFNISVKLNNCPSNFLLITLKDPAPPKINEIGNNGPLCIGSTLLLRTKTDAGVTFSWTGPNNFVSDKQNPTRPNVTLLDAGNYFLTITKNNCTTTEETEVIINALPSPPVTSDVEYCINTVAQPLSATPAIGSAIVWYSSATGGSGSSIAPTPSTTSAGITSFYVSQIDANGCESPRAEIKVTIHPDAIAEFKPTKILDCPPFLISSNEIGLKTYPQHNKFYEWYVDGNYIGEGITFPGYTIPKEDDTVKITLKTISLFGCKEDETSHLFATFKLPHPQFDLSTYEGCGPLKVNFVNNTPDKTFFNYKWDFGNGVTSTESDPGEMVYGPNPESGDTTYIVKLKTWNNCDTIELEKTITVKSKPIAIFTPSKTEGCSPMKVTFTNNTKGKNVTYDWDFGDGTTLSTTSNEEVMHTFNAGVPTTFTVRLTATNECGSDIKEFKIVVSPNPIKLKFAMNGPDHFGCAPHSIVIYNNSIGASSYFWDFGDGNFLSTTKGVDSIKHTYLIPGDFTITVKASNNCTDTTTTDFVKVYPKPKASFTADRYVVCIGNEVAFQNQSELGTSYLWDFGDGNNSTLSDPKHIYTKSGLYTVKLLVTRLNGPGSSCTETVEQKIQVKDSLPGSFTASTLTAECAPFTVNFKNNNQPSVTAHWDFGDGTTGEGDQIDHTYLLSGSYNVTLIVTVPGGCTYTSTQTITIKGPSGTMTYDAGYICDGTVRLAANATATDLYYWDFGDGKTETTSVPVVYHTYSLPGNYLPVLTLKNNAGCNFLIKGVDTVKIEKIEAGFSTSETKTCGNTSVNFKDTSHVYFGNILVEWDFGDGQKGSGFEVAHNYIATGTYTIAQTITGASGCTQTIKKDIFIHVNKNPSLVITAKNTGCNNESMQFDLEILSEDAINTVEWKISNGVSGNGKSFSYKFLTPGTYTISWLAGTVNGCFGTATHTITVYPAPTINASADQTICLGNSVQLKVSGTDTYQWSPIEGLSCTTCDNPVANPTKSTPYIASGFNSYGCVDRDTVYITVIPPLKLTSSGNDSICIGQSTKLLVSGAASYWWSPSEGLSSTSISNPVANPTITTKYRVVGYDGHGCFSDTAYLVVGVGAYPTIDLGPDQTLSTGTMLPLKSTITDGPIKDWKWTPSTNLDCDDCPEPIAHIKKNITYKVDVKSIYGCEASDTIAIKVFCENTQVFIPNAFTPDGDGVNDILMVRGTGIVMVKSFRIFNRWGVIVFERSNFSPNEPSFGWDGKINGKVSPSEVFVYTAEVMCDNGIIFTYKGNVSILK